MRTRWISDLRVRGEPSIASARSVTSLSGVALSLLWRKRYKIEPGLRLGMNPKTSKYAAKALKDQRAAIASEIAQFKRP
jgi:hypothetical protein